MLLMVNNIMYRSETKPTVVILCITYNHVNYIRDALNGFVTQKTDFPFIAIVHDDASTDGTQNIVREYANKYPNIIKPIYETENQYSKRDGSLRRIMDKACHATGAKYVAMCEGDDYWTDPLKLQKQVDFLESHPDYSMCFGNAIEHWEDGSKSDNLFSNIEYRDYVALEFVKNWIVPTATVICRREIFNDERFGRLYKSGKLIAGDTVLFLICAYNGRVRGFNDIFSVYRRLGSGVVMSIIDKNPYKFMLHEIALAEAFKGDIRDFYKHSTAIRVVSTLKDLKYHRSISIKYLWRAFYYAPMESLKLLFKYL